jgi:transcriptional regulator with XRE-family HTH domain
MRLRSLRQELGLTQEQAAEKMGLHPKYLTRLEGGGVNATLTTLIAASVAYKVSLRDLFSVEQAEE